MTLERILEHLRKHGSITSKVANDRYGCTRLSAYIWILRHKMGLRIDDEWEKGENRFGEPTHFKKYILIED